MNRQKAYELAAIALALVLGWAAFLVIDAPPMTRAEVADWAQGLGSIAAVAVAAWVGFLPLSHERQRRAEARMTFVQAIDDAAAIAMWSAYGIVHAIDTEDPATLQDAMHANPDAGGLIALGRLLKEPISTWPSATLYVTVELFCRGVAALRALEPHRLVTPKRPADAPVWRRYREVSRNVLDRYGRLEDLIRRERDA